LLRSPAPVVRGKDRAVFHDGTRAAASASRRQARKCGIFCCQLLSAKVKATGFSFGTGPLSLYTFSFVLCALVLDERLFPSDFLRPCIPSAAFFFLVWSSRVSWSLGKAASFSWAKFRRMQVEMIALTPPVTGRPYLVSFQNWILLFADQYDNFYWKSGSKPPFFLLLF
jgi:hypothetical protein